MRPPQEVGRLELYGLLGRLPDRHYPLSGRTLSVSENQGYAVETLALDLNGLETVPAYLVRPLAGGPHPCVLYNHAHGGDYVLGKRELLAGRSVLQAPAYAEALTARGIAALCIDAWLFGERRGRTESEAFKQHR